MKKNACREVLPALPYASHTKSPLLFAFFQSPMGSSSSLVPEDYLRCPSFSPELSRTYMGGMDGEKGPVVKS